ncbi:Transmembrane protease serine 9 [Orchesella cincta]|uniref:Transmembrane protease serine 9 n=1 Tax=Orchesella cincta TaxID=48709 RepID=A0A1D2NCB6_ORCCI|nr:Transmembrane protease serine 9 [Orchesella cincta]
MARKASFATILINILITLKVILGEQQSGDGWQLEVGHIPAGGVIRVADDETKSDMIPDPMLEVWSNPPISLEQIFTHPNYRYLSPLTECGYSSVEVVDYDVNEDETLPKTSDAETRRKRIVGGQPVIGQKHPWMAQIYLLNISSGEYWFHCGGTLISNSTVLIAAHCLTRIDPGTSLGMVVLGQADKRNVKFCKTEKPEENCSRNYIRHIEDYQVHYGYSEGDLINDIGLIYLRKPPELDQFVYILIQSSSILAQSQTNGCWLGLNGCGLRWPESNASKTSGTGLTKTFTLQQIPYQNICVGGNTGKATCNGDSGSGILKTLDVPLLDNKEQRVFQFGIVSAGGHVTDTCGNQGRPAIVTNVIHFVTWILNHIVPGALSYQWTKAGTKEGSWIKHKTNEGMFARKVQQLEELQYKNEFSTGKNVDVSSHPNLYLLPTFQHCGNLNTEDSVFKDETLPKRVKRVVGGIPTTAERYLPWMAQVYVRNVATNKLVLRCSGTLISCRHILTTAACVTEIPPPFVFDSIIVGQYNRNSSEECINEVCYSPVKLKVKDIIVHAEFEKYTYKNNIALVRLSQDVIFTRLIQPICLPQREALIDGMNVHRYFSAGWGKIFRETVGENVYNKLSEILLQMYVDILPRKDCNFVYSRQIGLLDRSGICGIGKSSSTGECSGDSGSPLMKKMEVDPTHFLQNKVFQLGIVSYTDCGLEGMPTTFYLIFPFVLIAVLNCLSLVQGECTAKLEERCNYTEDCCLGSCTAGYCNDGLYKNNRDRSVVADFSELIAAELSTGQNMDVSEHPNIGILPSYDECGFPAPGPRRQKRIVGGRPFELGKYPWAVALHLNVIQDDSSYFSCGASLITKRHILTADVAIIRLKHEVNFTDFIRPICLPRTEDNIKNWPDGSLTVIGWGTQNTASDEGPKKVSYRAQEVENFLVHRSNCDRFYTRNIGHLRRSHICAGGYPGKGDCAGDSGGPLFKRIQIDGEDGSEERYFLFGLVSTGAVINCAREGKPSVYTSVLNYMPWILDNLEKKPTAVGENIDHKKFPINPTDEFSTGMNPPVDLTKHKAAALLPKFPDCGPIFGQQDHKRFPSRSNHTQHRVKRIVGGISQSVGTYPWMVQLYSRHVTTTDLNLRCGGFLISKRYVLTGAHCVGDVRGSYVIDGVVLGNFNRLESRECIDDKCNDMVIIPIEDFVAHEKLSKYSREYDVAVVKLSRDVEFNRFIQPICLPLAEEMVKKAWPPGDLKYTAAGWGRVDANSNEAVMSNVLIAMNSTLESKKYCESVLTRRVGRLEHSRVCAGGSRPGKGECVGDTGGPMMRWATMKGPDGKEATRMYAFGILSIVECAHQGIPSLYQNLLYHMPWVMDQLEYLQ